MGKKKAIFVAALLAVAFGFTALVAVLAEKKEKTDGALFVTSFYPVYLLADSVAEGAQGVTVRNLTENHGGCIHDYTLTTQDMRLLSEAELFLINGGEMELFLTGVAEQYPQLTIVDTSAEYEFLEGVEHSHQHGEGAHDEHKGQDATESGDGHVHTRNGHLWLDIDGYLLQLSGVEEAFVAADPAQETIYRRNAAACREELLAVRAEYEEVKATLSGQETVVFHEGFVYLFRMLGIETVHCLAMDSDTQISAGEAAEIMEECKLHGITKLFAAAEYAQTVSDTFGTELGGTVVVLDPVTEETDNLSSGVAEKGTGVSFYCTIMRENLNKVKQAYGLQ